MRRRVLVATPRHSRAEKVGLHWVNWVFTLECGHTLERGKKYREGFEPLPPSFVQCLECKT